MEKNLKMRAKTYAAVLDRYLLQRDIHGNPIRGTRGARHLSIAIRLADNNQIDRALAVAHKVGAACGSPRVISSIEFENEKGLVVYQFELPPDLWQSYTRSELSDSRAIGYGENKNPVLFDFSSPHSLVAGSTQSGKSTLMVSAAVGLCQTYKPGEMELALIDPHSQFSAFDHSAHLALPRANSADEIANAFAFLNQTLRERKTIASRTGRFEFSKFVVLVDEMAASEVLVDSANLVIMQSISQEGAKFNIHVIGGTQEPTRKELPKILGNLNNRWIGALDTASTSARVTGRKGLQAHLLSGAGDFLHVNGAAIERLQVAMATSKDFESLPRAEVREAEVERSEVVEAITSVNITPKVVAAFWYSSILLGRPKAQELGLNRAEHEAGKQFQIETLCELKQLIERNLKCIQ